MSRFVFAFFLFVSFVFSDYISPVFDRNFSSYAGAENFISLQRGMEKAEDTLFPTEPIFMDDFKQQTQDFFASFIKNTWGRRLRILAVWLPAALSMSVTQHEVFGHGYRIRDLGSKYATVKGYRMYVVAGATRYEATPNLTSSQMLTIGIAGLEADSILANRIRSRWMRNGRMDSRLATLYAISATSLIGYSLSVHKTPTSMPTNGNDISGYLFLLNSTYPNGHVNYKSLRNFSLLGLLDPFLLYSLYCGSDYAIYGTSIPIPMLEIGSVKYLPVARATLTPFGLQGILENYLLSGTSQTCAHLRWGQNGPNSYYGLGVENQKVYECAFATLGLRLDIWHQPKVLFKNGALSAVELMELPKNTPVPQLYPDKVLNEKEFGVLASVIGTIGKASWPTRPYYELGYKTKGYIPGEALRQAPIIRLGLAGNF